LWVLNIGKLWLKCDKPLYFKIKFIYFNFRAKTDKLVNKNFGTKSLNLLVQMQNSNNELE
jgi:hypothetical protein